MWGSEEGDYRHRAVISKGSRARLRVLVYRGISHFFSACIFYLFFISFSDCRGSIDFKTSKDERRVKNLTKRGNVLREEQCPIERAWTINRKVRTESDEALQPTSLLYIPLLLSFFFPAVPDLAVGFLNRSRRRMDRKGVNR